MTAVFCLRVLPAALFCMSVCGCRSQAMPSAPEARIIRHESTIHGHTRADEYY